MSNSLLIDWQQVNMKMERRPLMFNNNCHDMEVLLSDLVLISVKRVSEGSVQAVLGVLCR